MPGVAGLKMRWEHVMRVCWLCVGLSGQLLAQTTDTNAPTAGQTVRDGQVVLPGSETIANLNGVTSAPRPERPAQVALPADIRQRLLEFEKLREAYLARQRELMRKLGTATDSDRARIRETMKEQRDAWLEQARKFRDEAQRRLEELKTELPKHQEVLDAARERAREAARGARERRGTD